MEHTRHNFSPKVKRLLAQRAMFKCSAPDCSRQTHKPNNDKTKDNILTGRAAHICAASPGGPRYDPHMSQDERTSIENGIWLCGHHADLIDKEIESYPAELLRKWVKSAEQRATENFNKPLFNDEEVTSKINSELHKFLIYGPKGEFVRGREAELLALGDDSFKKIDPRLIVKTDVIDGNVHRTLIPKNPKEYIPSIRFSLLNQEQEKILQSFFESGIESISFKNTPVFVDSPIFEHLSLSKGVPESIKIFRKAEECKIRVKLIGSHTHRYSFSCRAKLLALPGKIFITATLSDDFTKLDLVIPDIKGPPALTITTDFSVWDGLLLSEIENICETKSLVRTLANSHTISLDIRLSNGKKTSFDFSLSNSSNFYDKDAYLGIALILRDISEHFDLPIVFSEEFQINNITILNLVHKCIISEGRATFSHSQLKIRFEMLVPVEQLTNQKSFTFPITLSVQGYVVPVELLRVTFSKPNYFIDGNFMEVTTKGKDEVIIEIVEETEQMTGFILGSA